MIRITKVELEYTNTLIKVTLQAISVITNQMVWEFKYIPTKRVSMKESGKMDCDQEQEDVSGKLNKTQLINMKDSLIKTR